MAYYKTRFEVWCDWNPAESDIEEIARTLAPVRLFVPSGR
jgi:hypothetical protein